jgi:DNA-directed RNA polymerase II subunit RPB2
MFGDAYEDAELVPEEQEINEEDAWAVISAFFEEKGLVRQQLDSFDEFVSNTMQEIVDETPSIIVTPEHQHNPGQDEFYDERQYHIKFGQVYLSRPLVTEPDGETATLFPKEARLRNLT